MNATAYLKNVDEKCTPKGQRRAVRPIVEVQNRLSVSVARRRGDAGLT